MKRGTVAVSKVTPPGLPKVVPRERLFQLLDRKEHYRITWISGMAGSGKTTLVASYLRARNHPCVWYDIDESDTDLSTFFYYMGLAAKKARPRKRKPLPLLTPEYFRDVSTFAKRYFEALSSKLTPSFFIIFDNYQNASSSPLFNDVFRDGISCISPDIHTVVMSRTDPPSAFTGMLANNRMRVTPSRDLRMDLDESREIINFELGKNLPDTRIEEIHQKTQGWAAGLVLMAKSLKTGHTLHEDTDRFTPLQIFDYFAGELFDKMENGTQNFLLSIALLPSMTISMANEMTGRTDAWRVLSSLQRNHIFIEHFSSSAGTYQFHPLFREFLLSRVGETHGSGEIIRLKKHAAGILEASGRFEDAFVLFMEAGDTGAVVALIRNRARDLISQGRNRTLEQWIKQIPEDIRNANPWLWYWLGVSCVHFSSAEAAEYFQTAFRLFNDKNDTPGILLAWSGVVDSITYQWNYFTELDPWIEWFDNNISLAERSAFPEIDARVAVSAMCALLFRRPDHPHIHEWVERALSLTRKCNDINLSVQAFDWAITYYGWMGNSAKTEIVKQEVKELIRSFRTSPAMTLHWRWLDTSTRVFYGPPSDSAIEEITESLIFVKETGLIIFGHLFSFLGLFVSLMQSDFASADYYIKRFESVLDSSHYHEYCVFHHFSGLYNLLSENNVFAVEHARTAVRIAHDTGYIMPEFVCRFGLVQALISQDNHEEAAEELERASRLSFKSRSTMFEFMCLLAKAEIAFDREEEREGLKHLRKALSLGQENNYMMLVWWWQPDLLAKLCTKALEHDIEVKYVQAVIARHKLPAEPLPYHIDQWPWPLKIYTFGQFRMVKDGKPFQFTGKTQKKPLELLKALIACGGINISIDKIIDDLWYEADGDMARSAFSTTLNRLRSLLARKSIIQIHGGRISIDHTQCWTDTWAFTDFLRKADMLWQKGNSAEAIELCEKALGLYEGGFLAGDSRTPWNISARERFKNLFLSTVKRLGTYHKKRNEHERAIEYYKRGLAVDELEETLYQQLMACYHSLGRQAEAVRMYHRLKDILASVLDVAPSRDTEILYNKIR